MCTERLGYVGMLCHVLPSQCAAIGTIAEAPNQIMGHKLREQSRVFVLSSIVATSLPTMDRSLQNVNFSENDVLVVSKRSSVLPGQGRG